MSREAETGEKEGQTFQRAQRETVEMNVLSMARVPSANDTHFHSEKVPSVKCLSCCGLPSDRLAFRAMWKSLRLIEDGSLAGTAFMISQPLQKRRDGM